jgi:acetyl-CoA carboxylase carboxyltransferase component
VKQKTAITGFPGSGEKRERDNAFERFRAGQRSIEALQQTSPQPGKISHKKMTLRDRIQVLTSSGPDIQFHNWGHDPDGTSLITGILNIQGRDVALYGHDFTARSAAKDLAGGSKLARLFTMAGEKGIPLLGLNDSGSGLAPDEVGALDGYAEAWTALRNISGVVPSVMCLFGVHTGCGSFLPRQGSFVIQPQQTYWGVARPAIVQSTRGTGVVLNALGGPTAHAATGVADVTAADEIAALHSALRLLSYLPDNNSLMAPFQQSDDPLERRTTKIETLLQKASYTSGATTAVDVSIIIQQICDQGDFFELQPQRAPAVVTAFGRLGGYVVGFCAHDSAVSAGHIDDDAALKIARFIRFCNLYNTPILFIRDHHTGAFPVRQTAVTQAGHALLDALVDLRTPRLLLILRPAGVAAPSPPDTAFIGANRVLTLAMPRPAETEAQDPLSHERGWPTSQDNPVLPPSHSIVLPTDVRRVLGENLRFFLRHYRPAPMQSIQREFF